MANIDDDEDLLAALRTALAQQDAVTQRSREIARAAFTWRGVDAELMTLVEDSATQHAGEAVRGAGEPERAVVFRADDVILEIELADGHLLGRVIPGQQIELTLQAADGTRRSTVTAASGYFSLADVRPGPTRFVLERQGRRHTTPWLVL